MGINLLSSVAAMVQAQEQFDGYLGFHLLPAYLQFAATPKGSLAVFLGNELIHLFEAHLIVDGGVLNSGERSL